MLVFEMEVVFSDYIVEIVWDGYCVVIVGLFNVGKLSLLNILVKCDVVIVIDIVGIMCDVLLVDFDFDGVKVVFFDIVGLWEIEDFVEWIGIVRVRVVIEDVDFVFYFWEVVFKEEYDDEIGILILVCDIFNVVMKKDLVVGVDDMEWSVLILILMGEGIDLFLK